MTDRELIDLAKLRAFYYEVARLTVEHDAIDDHAVVYPNRLDMALKKIDPDWCKNTEWGTALGGEAGARPDGVRDEY